MFDGKCLIQAQACSRRSSITSICLIKNQYRETPALDRCIMKCCAMTSTADAAFLAITLVALKREKKVKGNDAGQRSGTK